MDKYRILFDVCMRLVCKVVKSILTETNENVSEPVPLQTEEIMQIAISPKTIEATGQENESKYRSGRGTGLLLPNANLKRRL